ncbi:MAG: hypothetical protein HC908_00215 [Calothrix sp. SM1_7_51]|nr:hypothetical protein [Calothrix sp. SM1_7_51]
MNNSCNQHIGQDIGQDILQKFCRNRVSCILLGSFSNCVLLRAPGSVLIVQEKVSNEEQVQVPTVSING